MKVIGIDPGLAHCGLATLHRSAQHYSVSAYAVYDTEPSDSMLARMRAMYDGVKRYLLDHAPYDAIIVESPIGKSGRRGRTARAKGQFKSPHDISAQGIATGVELAAALETQLADDLNFVDVVFIDADEWMPKTKSGNFTHTIKREQLSAWLKTAIRFPSSLRLKKHEHVIMAAGVARYWCEQRRLDDLLDRAKGARE